MLLLGHLYVHTYVLDVLCGALTNFVQFDIKHIFAIRETIFDDLFTFCSKHVVQQLQLTVIGKKSIFLKYAIVNWRCRNDWQRFGKYKEGHKILHEISINLAIEQDLSGHRTGHKLCTLLF